jgi:SAM-dependent methyltransferase
MNSYTFDNSGESSSARLNALEFVCDPITLRQFDRVGLREGWACLEIGAGSGSIAEFMARRVGPNGSVLATDIDTRFLATAMASKFRNIRIMTHDITKDPLPDQEFDAIHARNVLTHLSSARAVLDRFVPALRPGGWLIIEDFDDCVDRKLPAVDLLTARIFDRIWEACWSSIRKRGGSSDWGRHLGTRFSELGLVEISLEANFQLVRGGSPFAEFEKLTIERIAKEMVMEEGITEEEVSLSLALLDDPTFTHFPNVLFSACGRKTI